MNKNDECEIVKDLSSLHIENMLSESSQNFIEKHLINCKECQEYYNALNSTFLNENQKAKNNDEIEVNHLKKVNKKMTTLKWIIAAILWGILAILIIMYVTTYFINEIGGENNIQIQEIVLASTNYKFHHKTIYKYKESNITEEMDYTYYYKDGMNKKHEVYYRNGEIADEKIRYARDYDHKKTTVFPLLKQIDYQEQDFIEVRLGDAFSQGYAFFSGMTNTIRTEEFNGKECWVIRIGSSVGYTDNYLDKDSKYLIRRVSEAYSYYKEELFTLTENVVTDEDVDMSILESDIYKDYKVNNIDYKLDEKMREFYE